MHQQIVLLARYNVWMNAKLYDAAVTLPPAALALDRGAFFGSLIGTLNHLVVADTIWLTSAQVGLVSYRAGYQQRKE